MKTVRTRWGMHVGPYSGRGVRLRMGAAEVTWSPKSDRLDWNFPGDHMVTNFKDMSDMLDSVRTGEIVGNHPSWTIEKGTAQQSA